MYSLVCQRTTENQMARKLCAELKSADGSLAVDPTAPIQLAAKSKQPIVTIQDRLEAGNLTVDEVRGLKSRSRTGFYEDLKAGLVRIDKIGRKSIVRGPVAKRYIAGEPIEK
jgi:hypothetical protein